MVPCGRHIMVVDDDPDVRAALREHLESAGCGVVLAVDGIHALERLRSGSPPCLILLDLNMPRLDGDGFVQRIRDEAEFCGIRIVSMTAERERVRPATTEAHLHKPFELSEVDALVRRFCRSA